MPSRDFDSLSLAQHQTVRERMNVNNSRPYHSRMMGTNFNREENSPYHLTVNPTQHKVRFSNDNFGYPEREQFVSSVLPTYYESRNDYPTR
mmetsp:Transcript_17643/g.21584  ORF Transcript_17643/g.21584 Transcript_17643/m.21584 type:complete len:91 (+) Transcript_17643:265-537(+)